MRTISPAALAGTVVTLGLVLLSGCGNSAGPAQHVDLLKKIKKAGVVRVGVKADAPPFGTQDKRDAADRYGFDIDIASAIADELQVKPEFVTVTSANRIEKLLAGEVDMVVASMTITRGREEHVDFTIPYFKDVQGLLVRADSPLDGYLDLAGKLVGGVQGATSVKNIRLVQPECKVREYKTYEEALAALEAGEVDAITSDMMILIGLRLKAADPDKLKIAGRGFGSEPYGIAVPENQSDWRDAVNEAIQRLWESFRYQTIYENWFGEKARYHTDVKFSMETYPR